MYRLGGPPIVKRTDRCAITSRRAIIGPPRTAAPTGPHPVHAPPLQDYLRKQCGRKRRAA